MSTNNNVSHEDAVKTAFSILEESGIEAVSSEKVAKRLNCSTHSASVALGRMNKLVIELEKPALLLQAKTIAEIVNKRKYPDYLAYGVGFVLFAVKYKHLFGFLYIKRNSSYSRVFESVTENERIRIMCGEYGYTKEMSEQLNLQMAAYCYGLSLGLNSGVYEPDEDEIADRLYGEFERLTETFGKPKTMPDVTKWNHKIK